MLAVLLATVLGCGDLCRAEALDHYGALLAGGGYGRFNTERAAFLVREEDGTLSLERWGSTDFQRAAYRGRVPRGTIAVVHTHPAQAPLPSSGDRSEARRLGLPIVVVTPEAVMAAHPDGSVQRITADRRWWSAR